MKDIKETNKKMCKDIRLRQYFAVFANYNISVHFGGKKRMKRNSQTLPGMKQHKDQPKLLGSIKQHTDTISSYLFIGAML